MVEMDVVLNSALQLLSTKYNWKDLKNKMSLNV